MSRHVERGLPLRLQTPMTSAGRQTALASVACLASAVQYQRPMNALQIARAHERVLVRLVDVLTVPLRRKGPSATRPVRRVLLLRLERIGDLLMTLDALRDACEAWPDARIDLAVGAWNRDLAALIPGMSRVHTLSVPWLARHEAADPWPTLVGRARRWRREHYDVVVNFEPDVRTNFLAWLTGAPVRVGYSSGGGGSFLTDAVPYRPSAHVSLNAREAVARAVGTASVSRLSGRPAVRLEIPEPVREQARARLGASRPLVGLHVSGGRQSKQWHLERFAAVGRELASAARATIVLTGAPADAAMVAEVARHLHDLPVINATGSLTLIELAALLEQLDLLVSSDTGPMHMAGAVGTPVVALFGPSDPSRYGPIGSPSRVLRVSLPCSPCGMVRQPPERCRGHVPDCMDGIAVRTVVDAALQLLRAQEGHTPPPADPR
ncbi:MAG: glycosyltransferase family 9 protein [Vicinamibacterales bacterium]